MVGGTSSSSKEPNPQGPALAKLQSPETFQQQLQLQEDQNGLMCLSSVWKTKTFTGSEEEADPQKDTENQGSLSDFPSSPIDIIFSKDFPRLPTDIMRRLIREYQAKIGAKP